MKNLFKSFAAVCLLAMSVNAQAQVSATATATATATILNPITITKTTDLNFGIISPGATAGTVLLTPAPVAVRVGAGGVTLPVATPGTVTAAHFNITGTTLSTYAITLPSSVTLTRTSGSETMTASSFTSTPSGTGILIGAGLGLDNVYVGATLAVAAAQVPGVYVSGNFNVTVNYN